MHYLPLWPLEDVNICATFPYLCTCIKYKMLRHVVTLSPSSESTETQAALKAVLAEAMH